MSETTDPRAFALSRNRVVLFTIIITWPLLCIFTLLHHIMSPLILYKDP